VIIMKSYSLIAYIVLLLIFVTPSIADVPCPPPVADFTWDGSCFTDTSTGDITAWYWEFGDGTTSLIQNPCHSYSLPGIYSVNLTVTNECGSDSITKDISGLCPPPVAAFSAEPDSRYVPLTVQFTDQSTEDPDSWFWEFGDGATSTVQNPTHTYTEVGTYTVELTVWNDCGSDSTTAPINAICLEPVAQFTANSTSGYAPHTIQFTDNSENNVNAWYWEFGDGTTSLIQNPCHSYSLPGIYTVYLIAFNECGSDLISKDIVIPCVPPVANFAWDGSCFTDTSTGNKTAWYWEFGDGTTSLIQNPCHSYSLPGIYSVNLTVTNECGSDSITKDISSLCPLSVADFTWDGSCFTDTSTGNITAWHWEFGDGTTSLIQNPCHSYSLPGTYTVYLMVFNECGSDSITKDIVVPCSPPVANFTWDGSCFTDTSTGNITAWNWEFGDGTTSLIQNPCHSYSLPGIYSVNLTVTNECGSDSITKNIVVPCSPPVANFTWDGSCFTDTSTGNITAWNWEFGDGTTSLIQNPCHSYSLPGIYSVNLTVTNECGSDLISKNITIEGFEKFSAQLNDGWNTFSTPIKLNSSNSTFEKIFSPAEQQKVIVVLGWDGTQWYIPQGSTHVEPLYAYFIKVKEGTTATAVFVPSESVTTLPSRQIVEGINLIGPAPSYDKDTNEFQKMPLDKALVTIESVRNFPGYLIVVSPGLNQPGWSYAKGGPSRDLLPFKAYWIVMENGPDTLYGFSTTPIQI